MQSSFLDEHYAKSFAAIHQRFDVPLAYLGPERIRELIDGLDEAHRVSLGCYKPRWIWSKKAPTRRTKPLLLPFAWIEGNSGGTQVIQFLKNSNTLVLPELRDAKTKAACQAFVKGIEDMIYDSNRQVKAEYKFSNCLYP
jgi:hypothetical protein